MNRMTTLGLLTLLALVGFTSAHATIYDVSIINYTYVPDSITVAVGDSIRFTNNGSLLHTVTSGENCTFDGDFDSGPLAPGQTFIYVTDEGDAGLRKPYFCQFHCQTNGMVGSYSVLPVTPTKETTWGSIKTIYQ